MKRDTLVNAVITAVGITAALAGIAAYYAVSGPAEVLTLILFVIGFGMSVGGTAELLDLRRRRSTRS